MRNARPARGLAATDFTMLPTPQVIEERVTIPCAHVVRRDSDNRLLPRHRNCRLAAKPGSTFCGLHQVVRARLPEVTVTEGGWCVVCAAPATSFVMQGVTVALCRDHGRALRRALKDRT